MTDEYEKAGVNIKLADEFINQIKPIVNKTQTTNTLNSIGAFSSLFRLFDFPEEYNNPVLVTATDGVGTKILLAKKFNDYRIIGHDLVAMCVNDIICCGAKPLIFLDYYATPKIDLDIGKEIISGISSACIESNISLVGGETAEMPMVYQSDKFDLAGFCVGIIEYNKILDNSRIESGDALIGLKSNGFHSNGFSLINKLLSDRPKDSFLNTKSIVYTRTKIYVDIIKKLLNELPENTINGIAHITGGGLLDNIPRILPDNLNALIFKNSWKPSGIFEYIQEISGMDETELYETFNCGIGMVLIVKKQNVKNVRKIVLRENLLSYEIGFICDRIKNSDRVKII